MGDWDPIASTTAARSQGNTCLRQQDGLDSLCCACRGDNSQQCIIKDAELRNQTGYGCNQFVNRASGLHCNQLSRDITALTAYTMWQNGEIDLIVDVRTPEEYAGLSESELPHQKCGHSFTDQWDGCEIGHVPGAQLLSISPWDISAIESCKSATIATICYNHASHPTSAWRSNDAASLLASAGFSCVFNIVDGTKGWRDLGFPIEKGPAVQTELPQACKPAARSWPGQGGGLSTAELTIAALFLALVSAAAFIAGYRMSLRSNVNTGVQHPAAVFKDNTAPPLRKAEHWEHIDQKFADATKGLAKQREKKRQEDLASATVAWRKIDVDQSAAAELSQPAVKPSVKPDQPPDQNPPPATPPRPDDAAARKMVADAHVQLERMKDTAGAEQDEDRAAVL
jgi:rhodanese-related sulfurtransferase